jgi:hypothetical protein
LANTLKLCLIANVVSAAAIPEIRVGDVIFVSSIMTQADRAGTAPLDTDIRRFNFICGEDATPEVWVTSLTQKAHTESDSFKRDTFAITPRRALAISDDDIKSVDIRWGSLRPGKIICRMGKSRLFGVVAIEDVGKAGV